MTDKKQAIIDSALDLFSSKGFDAVPTSAIAKEAHVSEGLIFRHFQNKMGLLNVIMQLAQSKIEERMQTIKALPNPGEKITAIMEIPFHIPEEEHSLWKLIYTTKWQSNEYPSEISDSVGQVLIEALDELKMPQAEIEAQLILSYLDGFATTILLKKDQVDKQKLLDVLRKKYQKN